MGAWEAEAVGPGGFRGRWLSGMPKPMGARGRGLPLFQRCLASLLTFKTSSPLIAAR